MTTTSTQDLQGILNAKKAEIVGIARENGQLGDVIEVDVTTGEIVPVAATETSPVPGGSTSPALPVVAPAPVEVRYPEIPPKVVGGLPYVRDYMKLAKTICNTDFVPASFRGQPDAICAAFMRGYEMGFGPMQALASFNPIKGRVALTAEAMRALIMEAGHDIIIEDIVTTQTGKIENVIANCHRKNWPADKWAAYSFTMDDARTAGLLAPSRSGEPTAWQKYPRDMLQARATSGAGRRYFADVLAGMSYTPEEIRDFSGPDQEVTPSPPTTPPPVDSAPSTTISSPPSSSKSTPVDPSSSDPPKRPRGRPRKAQSAPVVAAPGPSASETATTAPETELMIVPSTPPGPPELTSLNSPGEIGVTREMLKALTQIIAGLPQAQQPLCRSFIRQHFPEGTAALTPADVQKCIDIAAGWPDSAEQHPAPESGEFPPF